MAVRRELAFPLSEYRRRALRVQEEMARRNIDLMLVTTLANVCYLTGIESIAPHKYWLAVVPRRGDPILLCEDFESHNALLGSWIPDICTYPGRSDPILETGRLVRKLGVRCGRLGVELNALSSLSAQGYLKLKAALSGNRLVDATDCVTSVMAIKSELEIACLRRAGTITGAAMRAGVAAVREGATDNDVAAAAYRTLISKGSEFPSYPVIVTTGGRSSVPHSTFKRVPIGRGDPVFMEIGACVHRYSAPMLRTAALGRPPASLRKMTQACVDSVSALLENIRAGALAGDVAAKSEVLLKGLPARIVWHGYYGYSVGLGFPPTWADHRSLIIRLASPDILQAGMVFHLSTSLRDVGRYGATCSETAVVRENGCEVLTALPRRLFLR
ncbi:MAG: Xaa-Pro peptidase family protein [Planctomycetota bacterium]